LKLIRKWRLTIGDLWYNFWILLGNWRRGISRRRLDYILIELYGGLPEYSPPPPWWRRFIPLPEFGADSSALSLSSIRLAMERIAADPRPSGVVLRLDGLDTGWATAQSLRQTIARFRISGKKVYAYADDLSTMNYFIACAADEILIPPIAGWNVIGLRMDTFFIRDALGAFGISADVIAVSPYKAAGDYLTRTEMSPEHKDNLDQILEAHFGVLVDAIADGRSLTKTQVHKAIDQAPLSAVEANEAGLIDQVIYLDAVEEYLREKQISESKSRGGVRIVTLGRVWRRLRRPLRKRSGKAVGIVALEGTIVPGPNRRMPVPFPVPFLDSVQAGSESISKALRQAEKDPAVAAIVFYVDSRGGATLASDLIWREVARIRRKKPIVVYMNNSAASGGYYVSADADWIVAQPLTVTGSIGVIMIKLALKGLYERLNVQRSTLTRGAHAELFSEIAPLDPSQKEILTKYIFELYDRFKEKVAAGRNLKLDKVEELAGGRLWLGKQALDHQLVDQLGDFKDAVDKAKQLANLDPEMYTPTFWILPGGGIILPGPIPPQPFKALDNLSTLLKIQDWMISPHEVVVK
jgi:protease-4